MSSTDEPAVSGGGHEAPPPAGRPGWQKAARRYGPIALVVVPVPFDGDNDGATSPGVTADSVKVVAYLPDPAIDPVGASLIAGAGANLDPALAMQTMRDYAEVFNAVFETYRRRVDLDFYAGTGAADDQTAARADAAIAEQEPFAVLGGPLQVQAAFSEELAARDVISIPAQPLPQSITVDNYPLIWGVITPTQAATLAAEAIANLAGPGPAEPAGDPALQDEERAYAAVHYDTADGSYQESFDALRNGLADGGIELATDIPFVLDPNRAQEDARTMVARLEEAGNAGTGSYRFANGGERYRPGELPDSLEAAGLFDDGSSIVV